MITAENLDKAKPSTSPPLDGPTVFGLPGRPVLYLEALGVREVCVGVDGRVGLARWDSTERRFGDVEPGVLFRDLCQMCWYTYPRFLRLPRLACVATIDAVRSGRKTVSRRVAPPRGFVPGRIVALTDGARRPGVLVLALAEIVGVRRESIDDLGQLSQREIEREGLSLSAEEFDRMSRRLHRGDLAAGSAVWRIEWRYVTEGLS